MKSHRKITLATEHVARFSCLGPSCPDTCCAGWTIDVDEDTRRKYDKKPDLKAAYAPAVIADYAMLCEGKNADCVMHDEGWCTIQARYGEDFLSNACYFFPRTFRLLGNQQLEGLSLACPESTRLTLFEDISTTRHKRQNAREMKDMSDRKPENMPEEIALQIHSRILSSLDDATLSAEQHLSRLIRLCFALKDVEQSEWLGLTESYLQSIPPAPANSRAPMDDAQVLFGFFSVAVADSTQYRPRLYQTLRDMEKALQTPLHWTEGTQEYTAETEVASREVHQLWQDYAPHFAPLLRRWLVAYVANWGFPFAGLGKHPSDNAFLLATHFATTKLALICGCYRARTCLNEEETVRIVQSIGRLYDHITDSTVFFEAFDCEEWQDETRLRALYGG